MVCSAATSDAGVLGVTGQGPALYHLPGFYHPVSAVSHLLGAALFVVLGVLLLRRGRGDAARVAFLGVYAFSCVLLLSVSGVYHMTVTGGAANAVMLRLDHAAIFVLIAGTYTPAHGLLFRGPLRWGPLLLMWAAAAAAVTLKTVYFRSMAAGLGVSLYLALGWLGGASGLLLWRRHGFAFVRPLLLGGLAYSAGAVIEFLRWPVLIPGVVHPHELFHLAVLAGALLHWRFVRQFAAGHVGASEGAPARRSDS